MCQPPCQCLPKAIWCNYCPHPRAEDDRREIQRETGKQDELLQQIGTAVESLHIMSKARYERLLAGLMAGWGRGRWWPGVAGGLGPGNDDEGKWTRQ